MEYRHLEEDSESDLVSESWGGSWTKEKLDTFEEYVRNVYLKIMNHQRDKYSWKLIYLDTFAGSGSRFKGKAFESKDALVSIFPKELLPDEEIDVYQGAAERELSEWRRVVQEALTIIILLIKTKTL